MGTCTSVLRTDITKSIGPILLVGTGGSGKSTFCKANSWDVTFNDQFVLATNALWKDPAVQLANSMSEFQLQVGEMEILISNLENYLDDSYVLTTEDILRARQRTTGGNETRIVKNKTQWTFIDLGGQFSERSKWQEYVGELDSVEKVRSKDPVAFLAFFGLDEFDVRSNEDPTKTKLQLSMDVVMEFAGLPETRHLKPIVVFNKRDIFSKKINSNISSNPSLPSLSSSTSSILSSLSESAIPTVISKKSERNLRISDKNDALKVRRKSDRNQSNGSTKNRSQSFLAPTKPQTSPALDSTPTPSPSKRSLSRSRSPSPAPSTSDPSPPSPSASISDPSPSPSFQNFLKYFPNYKGPFCEQNLIDFLTKEIKQKFKKVRSNAGRERGGEGGNEGEGGDGGKEGEREKDPKIQGREGGEGGKEGDGERDSNIQGREGGDGGNEGEGGEGKREGKRESKRGERGERGERGKEEEEGDEEEVEVVVTVATNENVVESVMKVLERVVEGKTEGEEGEGEREEKGEEEAERKGKKLRISQGSKSEKSKKEEEIEQKETSEQAKQHKKKKNLQRKSAGKKRRNSTSNSAGMTSTSSVSSISSLGSTGSDIDSFSEENYAEKEFEDEEPKEFQINVGRGGNKKNKANEKAKEKS